VNESDASFLCVLVLNLPALVDLEFMRLGHGGAPVDEARLVHEELVQRPWPQAPGSPAMRDLKFGRSGKTLMRTGQRLWSCRPTLLNGGAGPESENAGERHGQRTSTKAGGPSSERPLLLWREH
jgi:hypothetical protein